MNATVMHRRHTDPVQLQVAGVSEQRAQGNLSGKSSAWLIQSAIFSLTVELCPVLTLLAVGNG